MLVLLPIGLLELRGFQYEYHGLDYFRICPVLAFFTKLRHHFIIDVCIYLSSLLKAPIDHMQTILCMGRG